MIHLLYTYIVCSKEDDCVLLGFPQVATTNELVAAIEKNLGKKAVVKQVSGIGCDMNITSADLTLVKQQLGYEPKTDLEEGINKFVKWYQENKTGFD